MKIIETNWNWRTTLCERNSTKYIVLHHMASKYATAEQIDLIHKNSGWSGIGYHFLVRKDGTIYRGRPLWSVGAHVVEKNNCSIGVGAEGDYSVEEAMPSLQKNALKSLITHLKSIYPNAEIVGHSEVGASECPGRFYPLEELKNCCKQKKEKELTMTQYEELKNAIELLKKENNELKARFSERCGYFNYIDANMNKSYVPTIRKLVAQGKLKGNDSGELMLTNDMMRILTIIDRCGLFN